MKHALKMIAAAAFMLATANADVTVKPGPEDTMILENDLLRLEIAPTGARIVSLYDKLRERENVKMLPFVGGLNEVRFRGQLELNDRGNQYELSEGKVSPEQAIVKASYALPDDAGTVIKTYTLSRNSSDIGVMLQITNDSTEQMSVMPWIRHLLLRGPAQPEEAHMLPHGAFLRGNPAPGHPGRSARFDWHYFPAGNWTSRVLLPLDEQSNTLVSVLRPEDMVKTYNWHRSKEDFSTQEFIAAPIFVEPGHTEDLTYHIAVTAPVRNIVYASPELVIGATPHPSGIAPDTKSLGLTFSSTEPMDSLQVKAVLTGLDGSEPILSTDFTVTTLSPQTINTHAIDIALEHGKAYQLRLTFTRDGKPYFPGAEVGDEYPVIIPLTAGNPHPDKPVYPDRASELSRLRKIQPRTIEAPLLGRTEGIDAYSRPADVRVFPKDRFIANTDGAVELQAARGDYEAFQVALQSTREKPQTVTVAATALTGPDGQQIPCDSVNKFLYVTTRMPSKYNALYPLGTYPEALLPTSDVELPANGNAPVFVMYRIPEDAASGTYTGAVTVGDNLDISVTLKVWNITLPKRSPWYDAPTSLKGLGTGGVTVKNAAGEKISRDELLRAVEDIHFTHRLTPCDSGFARSLLALNLDVFEPAMQRYVDAGATKIYLGSIDGLLKLGEDRLQRIEKYLDSKGWQDYFYVRPGFDEASPDLVPQIAETCRKWKEVSTIPIMETYYHEGAEPLFGLMDIYCRGGLRDPEWVRERLAAGDEFWKVNMKAEPLEGELWQYRRKSLGFFDKSFTGTYIWTIKQWDRVTEWGEDYWCDAGVGNLDAVMIWPHETGVLSTIRLEIMREAIEDNALLWMLRKKVAELEDAEPHSQQARTALAEAREICDSVPLVSKVHSADDMRELRRRVGETLSLLNSVSEPEN